MDNAICKAKIKSKCLVLIIIYVILFCVVNLIFFDTNNDTKYEIDHAATYQNMLRNNSTTVYNYSEPPKYKEKDYRLWGLPIVRQIYDVREDIEDPKEGIKLTKEGKPFIIILVGILIVPPLLMLLVFKRKSKKSKLELSEDGITAVHKKMFSTENLKLSIDKIENAIVKKNFYNILTGGKTIVICTNSGNYKFPWVQNADEFVDATLAKIEEAK